MFSNILVAIDLEHGETTTRVLRTAAQIAATNRAHVHLLNVIPAAPVVVSQFLTEGYEHLAAGNVEKELQTIADDLGRAADTTTCHVRFGVIYQEILAQSEASSADLIVLGCHEAGVSNFLLGSNASRVVRHATCSVFVIR